MHNYRYTGETDEVFRRLDAASALEARIPEALDSYKHDRALTLLQAQEVIQACLANGMDTVQIPDHIIDTMFHGMVEASPVAISTEDELEEQFDLHDTTMSSEEMRRYIERLQNA